MLPWPQPGALYTELLSILLQDGFRDVIIGQSYVASALTGFSLKDALPDLSRFVVLFLVWYLLVRWLHFKLPKTLASEPAPLPERAG